MKLIHEVDPAVNYYPLYSIEYRLKKNPTPHLPQPWSQFALVPSKRMAWFLNIEVRLQFLFSCEYRVRVL